MLFFKLNNVRIKSFIEKRTILNVPTETSNVFCELILQAFSPADQINP